MAKQEDKHLLKKHYILCLLTYLKENTDSHNTKTIEEIKRDLQDTYGIEIEQKAIRNNLKVLIDLDYPIKYATVIKRSSSVIKTDVYFDQEEESGITESELYLLIDSILASKYVDAKQANNIAKWLVDQGPISFRQKYSNLESSDYGYHTQNKTVFLNIELLQEAFYLNKKITFNYKDYDADGNLKIVRGNVKASPYYTAMHRGVYYLICKVDGSDEIEALRMDKLFDVELLSENRVSLKKVAPGFNIKQYLESHVYMFPGKEQAVKVRIKRDCFSDLYDFFGGTISVDKKASDDEYAVVIFKANLEGLFYWALQYGANAEVLEPQEVRERILEAIRGMFDTYLRTDDDRYYDMVRASKEFGQEELDLVGIDLSKNRDYLKYRELKCITVGFNNLKSYDFLNNIKTLKEIQLADPLILNELKLDLPELACINFVANYKDSAEGNIPRYKISLDSLKNCPNIKEFCFYGAIPDNWDDLLNFKELEHVYFPMKNLKEIDLSKFSSKPRFTGGFATYYMGMHFDENIKRHKDAGQTEKYMYNNIISM